eukprot:CAMPEP_0117028340 /NCGR_PEP_ID=MMETSP0472-20121206/20616_1 /TAXON_ID=693140 ORGANISM="Tiarina fusus, Strain LIS" /NCGR_SAMPLE_ID=MMETSP0472 /ASSEMBLY_ACC=CAM_ASM_000603 /LENGTH=524 /DNA_ID=CAMNT_0004735803 /DNA_START=124 /DNA_END=1698 /DNA_ORIENTATION=+
MFGWINDCTECLVTSKFGEDTWHDIKVKAGCNVPDGGFLRYKYYPDGDTVELVVAASEVLDDDVLYAFGDYFIDYVKDNGYSNVLECLGSNMRDWLSNLNSLHDHLQASYPKGFVAPVFWSEDDVEAPSVVTGLTHQAENSNAILVHYYSKRGSLLVPLVVGLLKKVAMVYFEIDINVEQLQLQDEEQGINNTSWRVTTTNPNESYKLRGKKKKLSHRHNNNLDDDTVTTTATSTHYNKYLQTFREGGNQAANLRVEEFVMRSFYNEDCQLFHALTLEQYLFLIEYWKTNQIVVVVIDDDDDNDDNNSNNKSSNKSNKSNNNNKKWCYEIWSMQDDDPKSWAQLSDLPDRLHPETIDSSHFGGMVPETGRFPPDERGVLQSVPPKIRLVNKYLAGAAASSSEKETSSSVDLCLNKYNNNKNCDETTTTTTTTLEEAIYNAPEAEALWKAFPKNIQERLDNEELELQCVVWNDETDSAYHTFSLGDLKTTSTLQLYELVPRSFDPIKIVLECAEVEDVDDDEEDL